MNNNQGVLIGAVIVIVVLIAGYFIWKGPTTSDTSLTATSTPTDSTGGVSVGSGSPVVGRTPGKATIVTGPHAIVSSSQAFVDGTITPNGTPTTYWYEYGLTSTLGSALPPQNIGSGYFAVAAPAVIGSLSPNTTYYFRIVASNASGTVTGASYNFTTNSAPPPPGTSPAVHTDAATSLTRTGATVNGRLTPNQALTSYWFEFGTSNAFGDETTIQTAGNGTGSKNVSATLTNLEPATKYYFRLNAQNQFGTVVGSVMTFTTKGPAK